jgi:hypothetical protein
MRTFLPAVFVSCCLILPAHRAAAQETRPADELAKENRELKEYIERLERRLGEVEARSKSPPPTRDELRRRFDDLRRRDPQPYIQPLPPARQPIPAPDPWGRFFFKPPTPAPAPAPQSPYRLRVAPPATVPPIPPGARRYRFNGQDVFVIPLT